MTDTKKLSETQSGCPPNVSPATHIPCSTGTAMGMPVVAAPSPATEHHQHHVHCSALPTSPVESSGCSCVLTMKSEQDALIAAAYRDAKYIAGRGICTCGLDQQKPGRHYSNCPRGIALLIGDRTPAHARAAFEEEVRKAREKEAEWWNEFIESRDAYNLVDIRREHLAALRSPGQKV